MKTDGRRPRRVAEQVREYLSSAIVTELGDRRLNGLVITRVEITDDLGFVDVHVRLMLEKEASQRAAALSALERASSRLRRGLGPKLKLKRVPALRFHYDTAPDARARVDELLDEWRREQDG